MSNLLIIALAGLITISSLFLFSSPAKPESQSANIIENVITPTSISASFPTPHLETWFLSSISSPTPVSIPTPNTQESPIHSSPTPTPISTLAPTTTPKLETRFPSASISISTPNPTPAQSAKININTAGKQELGEITGVGPVIAQRIIDYRQSNGPFQKIENIKNVKGIGDKTFEKMKNEITI